MMVEIRSEVLKNAINNSKYSQAGVAKAIGISVSTLSNAIKTGKMKRETLANICETIGVKYENVAVPIEKQVHSISTVPINSQFLRDEIDKWSKVNHFYPFSKAVRYLSKRCNKSEKYLESCLRTGKISKLVLDSLCEIASININNVVVADYQTKQYTRMNIEKVKTEIRESNKSVADIATSMGVKTNDLFSVLHSEGIIEKSMYLALCKAFNVDIGYFSYTKEPIFYDKGYKIPTAKKLKEEKPTVVTCYFDADSFKAFCEARNITMTKLSTNVLNKAKSYLSQCCSDKKINADDYAKLKEYFGVEGSFKAAIHAENDGKSCLLDSDTEKSSIVSIQGELMYNYLIANKFNLAEFARDNDTSTAAIRGMITDNKMDITLLSAMCEKLNVSVSMFVTDEDVSKVSTVDLTNLSVQEAYVKVDKIYNEILNKLKDVETIRNYLRTQIDNNDFEF